MAGFNPDPGRAYPAVTTQRASRSLVPRSQTSQTGVSSFLRTNLKDLSAASSVATGATSYSPWLELWKLPAPDPSDSVTFNQE